MLKLLAMALDTAIEYGLLDGANPARGRRRRLKEPTPKRTWVEPEQLVTLLEAAPKGHRPVIAVPAGAGLRVGEACALDWRDLDLAAGTLTVQESKTPARRREVDLPSGPITELWTLAATSPHTEPDDPVFIGTQGTRQTPANVSRRLKSAIKKANPKLEALGIAPLSERVSPHSLRRTYASLRYACGDDSVYVAEQGGWADPTFPIRVYARAVRRRERLSGAQANAFDEAIEWAGMGRETDNGASEQQPSVDNRTKETAP